MAGIRVWQAWKENHRVYNYVYSVRCGCDLKLAMISKQETIDGASSFSKTV